MAKRRGRTLTRATQGPQLYALDKGRSELASLMRLPDDARQPLTTKDKAKDQGQDPQTTVKGNEPDDACIQLSESEYYHPTDKDKVLSDHPTDKVVFHLVRRRYSCLPISM